MWTEVVSLTKLKKDIVVQFLDEHVITKLWVPLSLVFDNSAYISPKNKPSFLSIKELICIMQQTNILRENKVGESPQIN